MEQDSSVNLKWDTHQVTLKSIFDTFLDTETLADCTLSAESQYLKAHRLILSACSQYFEELFSHHHGKHPIIILPGVPFRILKTLIEFMYRGEILVPQDELDALLQLANFLKVKGLSYDCNMVPEKKQVHKIKNKLHTCSEHTPSQCHAPPERYEHCDSPELLEVCGGSFQSVCLQKQDYTKANPISALAGKHKKNDWHSSREEPSPQQHSLSPSHTVSRNFPLQRSELPDKRNSAHSVFSDVELKPSQTRQLPVFREGNFSEMTVSGKELISAKPLNSRGRTSVYSTINREKTILETFTEPKTENFNEDCVHDVILNSDDTQRQSIGDDNGVTMREITEHSFCDEEFFTQQMQFQQIEWTNTVPGERTMESNIRFNPTEQTSASNSRFKCQSCDRSYRHHRDLQRHLKYECGTEPQFQCPHCLVQFRHKHRLKEHMFRHYR